MRTGTVRHEARSSALWGKRSGSRNLASGRTRRIAGALALTLVLAVGPLGATAYAAKKDDGELPETSAFVAPTLLEAAGRNDNRMFHVIITGDGSRPSRAVANVVANEAAKTMQGDEAKNAAKILRSRIGDRFRTMQGVAAHLDGEQILRIANRPGIVSIMPDAPVELSSTNFSNSQLWTQASGVSKFWPLLGAGSTLKPPAIAVIDSGIDKNRADFGFGAGVAADIVLTDLDGNSPGDGRGHGTFVAGIASGRAPGYAGAVPTAPIVSIDVMDDKGMAMTSDVIRAADWILANKDRYNIRVANFSLHSTVPSSFMYDPLSKAVQKLWFNGVVVVAASGNYGIAGGPSGVTFAPGSDPFIITVGATDLGQKLNIKDDGAAPWSAYGYTNDGFAKPELSAPGRYMIGPVPATSTLALERPEQVRGVGYIELSGTSFAAPLVAGMASYILAVNPTWTPDQVKGALMLTATAMASADPGSAGVGNANGPKAAAVTNPPNPNLALNAFLVPDETGAPGPVFDSASWAKVATEDASWASASWASASWANASWASASWASASWANASWASASWDSASWASASWASYSYEDNAAGEEGVGGLVLTPEEEAFFLSLLEGTEATVDEDLVPTDDLLSP